MAKAPSQNIDGVVLLDKPEGLSSNAALQRARRHFGAAKAGHTGTLDPFATGLLPVCLGEATKFSQGLLDADKGYRATAVLGITTDTGDREGRVLVERPVATGQAAIEDVLAALTGPLQQVPPMYSALKHQGRPLYEIARAGGEVARAARAVHIHRLELVDWTPPLLVFDVLCSKGTYVRTLAEEIGERLGTGAHLRALRRTSVGPFGIERALTLADLETLTQAQRLEWVLPTDLLVQTLPALLLDAADAQRLLQGREVDTLPEQRSASGIVPPAVSDADGTVAPVLLRLYGRPGPGPERSVGSGTPALAGASPLFLGVGALDEAGRLRSVRLIAHTAGPGGPKTVPAGSKPAESA